jgi:intracellular sulfur oxidation DsrE/DsrF family protein
MAKYILILFCGLFFLQVQAQDTTDTSTQTTVTAPHRIVFQLSTADTLAHKALMKQIRNITSVAPDTKIEVVCHGPGLNVLVKDKTTVQTSIQAFQNPNITFVACEFSMKERNVSKEQIIPEAGFVKAGILEIVIKQEAGWSYIKSGF